MLEDIKFRSVCHLEKLCVLSNKSNEQLLSDLSKLTNIVDMKRQTVISHIPCEFVLISDGFMLFGAFGSISGRLLDGSYSISNNRLSLFSNGRCYRLIFKGKEIDEVKGLLEEMGIKCLI